MAHGNAWPGQILGQLQFKTMYLYTSKTAPIWPFDMISSSRQVFMPFGQGFCIYKSQKIFYFDQVIEQNHSPSKNKKQKQTCCHDYF